MALVLYLVNLNETDQPMIMKILRTLIIAIAILSLSFTDSIGQRSKHEIHAMMVFNFTKYIQWPASSSSGDFVIGVIGDSEVHATMSKLYGAKTKGSQQIVIKKINKVSEIGNCHVLYVGESSSGQFEAIKGATSGKSTLVVTDKSGLGKKGSGINFKMVGNKLKFEMNQKAMSTANLKVASQLSGMAIII